MMAVVAVNSMPIVVPVVVPVIRRAITIVSIGSIVSVRVIAVSIGVIAIAIARITEPDSH
jgi:hypothetical protein